MRGALARTFAKSGLVTSETRPRSRREVSTQGWVEDRGEEEEKDGLVEKDLLELGKGRPLVVTLAILGQ